MWKQFAAVLALATALPSWAVQLQNVRFSSSPEKTRVVFDLSEKPKYTRLQAGQRFELLIEGLEPTNSVKLKTLLTPRIRFRQFEDETRMVFQITGEQRLKTFLVGADPKNNKPERLVIDLLGPDGGKAVAKASSKPKAQPVKPMTEDQAMGLFEKDVTVIRLAVQKEELDTGAASELTERKRKAVANRFALAQQSEILYPDVTALQATPKTAKAQREKAEQAKVTQLPVRRVDAKKLIAEPLPKGVHQAPQTDKELQVCLAARKLLESMGGEYAQVAALPKADFEKRIAAIQEAHSTGRLTKAQAAELIARQRRLFQTEANQCVTQRLQKAGAGQS